MRTFEDKDGDDLHLEVIPEGYIQMQTYGYTSFITLHFTPAKARQIANYILKLADKAETNKKNKKKSFRTNRNIR
jgi:hypothetical protein